MRHPATCLGLAITAAAAASGFASPVRANSALVPAAMPMTAEAPLSAHYDTSRRELFIGSRPPIQADFAGKVTVSRAADLVGQQLRPVWRPAPRRPGSGALPTSMPVSARAMTSGFGLRNHPLLGGRRAHQGVDLAAPTGSPITATSDGRVGAANWNGGYGLFVSLNHGGGVETRYGHMSRLNVVPGQQVRKGDVIGYVGSTGRSTGPHLHYEVRQNGRAVNPAPLLNRR